MLRKILSIVLIILILGALGILTYILVVPNVGETFTDFYILGDKGKAADYPESLRVGESGKIIVGITNNEKREMSYRVEVKSAGITINEIGPVKLGYTQTYEKEIDIILTTPGEGQKVEFLLFKENEDVVYRSLYLRIDVVE